MVLQIGTLQYAPDSLVGRASAVKYEGEGSNPSRGRH